MPWLTILLASGPTSVTPVDSAVSSILGYIAGFGCLGYLVLALVFRWLVPGRTAERDRAQARADLENELARVLAEREAREARLIEDKKLSDEQRDEALKIAQEKMIPLLASFNDTARGLIPLLQEVVRNQEGGGHAPRRAR